jgi:hypothetical protein
VYQVSLFLLKSFIFFLLQSSLYMNFGNHQKKKTHNQHNENGLLMMSYHLEKAFFNQSEEIFIRNIFLIMKINELKFNSSFPSLTSFSFIHSCLRFFYTFYHHQFKAWSTLNIKLNDKNQSVKRFFWTKIRRILVVYQRSLLNFQPLSISLYDNDDLIFINSLLLKGFLMFCENRCQ